jgi:hypothetical protein
MKLAVLAAAAMLVTASSAFAQSIGGKYDVEGTNFDGSAYQGTAEITLTSETTCVIEWQTQGTTSSGICMRNDAAFAAAYELNGEVGLVVYRVQDDGTLDGLWTLAGKEGNGTEVLTPQ